ncbi:MAG TPA: tRNA lysidine(34) synthetase TilS [Flavisolibacter sp.]|nr:tRNA lysidine(34) synthetase TilS [Flavisolibacter sp.]
MNCVNIFQNSLQRYGLVNTGKKLLLAVSGGVDSVVLCELSKQAGLQFAIAHCNFGLRGEESERDETFVRSLGEKYGVEVFVKKFDTKTYAEEVRLSIQEAARKLRYDWFEVMRKSGGFDYALLAHHADDNIETLLMNFFRGSGLEGLTGMPEKKKGFRCLRPMLQLRRAEIEAFAKTHKLAWVEDSSNASSKYTRNLFRNELLPQLKTVFPNVEENLLNNIKRLQQTTSLYNELMEGVKKKVYEVKGEEVHIPVLKLMKYKDTSLIYEIIKDFGFGEKAVEEVIKLANADSGKYIANEQYRIIRHRAWFIIAPLTVTAQTFVLDKDDSLLQFGDQQIRMKRIAKEKFSLEKDSSIAQLDAKEIKFPLVLRKWKAGDYFYPLGMRKKKKLARFFIDQKLSKTEKEKVWVVESHKRIVWIIGYRIDDRFKVTDATKDVLQLSLSSL